MENVNLFRRVVPISPNASSAPSMDKHRVAQLNSMVADAKATQGQADSKNQAALTLSGPGRLSNLGVFIVNLLSIWRFCTGATGAQGPFLAFPFPGRYNDALNQHAAATNQLSMDTNKLANIQNQCERGLLYGPL
jgi:hypothetical protein